MTTILITGASSGIGCELAKVCAKNGHDLVLVARHMVPLIDPIFKTISVTYLSLDLSKPNSARKLYDEVKKRKIEVNILINNAGVGDFSLFHKADINRLKKMIHLNIASLTELSHYFLQDMIRKKSGKIMNLASTASFLPGPLMAVYYATKHYVLALTEALAEELRGSEVTVTALCPGPTKSNFHKAANISESSLIYDKNASAAYDVAVYGYNAMMNGKRVAIFGFKNALTAFIPRFLPRNLVARLVYQASMHRK